MSKSSKACFLSKSIFKIFKIPQISNNLLFHRKSYHNASLFNETEQVSNVHFKRSPPEGLQEARDYSRKGTLCDQVTCESTHHEDMVISSNIGTQLSNSSRDIPRQKSILPRKLISFYNDYK